MGRRRSIEVLVLGVLRHWDLIHCVDVAGSGIGCGLGGMMVVVFGGLIELFARW